MVENVNYSNRAVKGLLQLGKNEGVAALEQNINVGEHLNKSLMVKGIDTLDEIIPNTPQTNYVNLYIRF